jgi:hypothetical protein
MAFVVVNKQKEVQLLTPNADSGLTEVKLQVGFTTDNVWVVFYPKNHFRLLDLDGSKLRIWEIGLVRQGDKFFLVSQCVYTVGLFRGDDGRVVCPAFERAGNDWPELVKLIGDCFVGHELALQPPDYAVPWIKPPRIMDNYEGWVQWYNYCSGLGVVITSHGPARVHWTDIVQPEDGRFVCLQSGQMVRFFAKLTDELAKQSTIPYQLRGVSPI